MFKNVGPSNFTPKITKNKTTPHFHTDVRLVNSNSYRDGRVEVYDGHWGTVCDDYWDINDANIVCRSLGYGDALEAVPGGQFGWGSGSILMDDVACDGMESSIFSCERSDSVTINCGHNEDAGAICSGSLLGLLENAERVKYKSFTTIRA